MFLNCKNRFMPKYSIGNISLSEKMSENDRSGNCHWDYVGNAGGIRYLGWRWASRGSRLTPNAVCPQSLWRWWPWGGRTLAGSGNAATRLPPPCASPWASPPSCTCCRHRTGWRPLQQGSTTHKGQLNSCWKPVKGIILHYLWNLEQSNSFTNGTV